MIDRYTKFVLTVIAGALLYLAAILTPIPAVTAQAPSLRPGESSGPTQVVVVGWRTAGEATVPVSIQHPVQVTASQPLRITGAVTTERSEGGLADRVVLVGWERDAVRNKAGRLLPLNDSLAALPVRTVQ
jgi:hypothetical protein